MSDKNANGALSGTPTGSTTGNRQTDDAKVGELAGTAATPSIAQGLQSVMAVIGENYDPGVSGAVEKAATPAAPPSSQPSSQPSPSSTSRLTDKIDAARLKQTEGSSVTRGLQSIMAVIGEDYQDDTPEPPPPPAPAPAPSAPGDVSQQRTKSAPSTMGQPLLTATNEGKKAEASHAVSDLLPLLTDSEQDIAHTHHPVVVDEQMSQGSSTSVVAQDSSVSDLLNQLKSDIRTLEKGSNTARQQFNMPAVIDTASNEVKRLLAELQGDISALRTENDALKTQYNVPTALPGQGSEIASLLNQLKGDIAGLRQENDALKSKYGISSSTEGSEISHLLAQLQGDISGLRQENDSFKAYYNMPQAPSKGSSFGQALLMTIGLLTLVGGATIGGMYYANRMNDQTNENLLALLGLQQAATPKPVVVEPKPVIAEPKKVEKPKVVAAVAPPPPPALPKITVKRPKLDSAEVQALLTDAQNLIELGDLVSARQMLEYAMSQKSAEAAYKLAQTFDPLYLATMASVLSVEPNLTRAKVLYYSAARQGHQAASKRLSELRRTPAN